LVQLLPEASKQAVEMFQLIMKYHPLLIPRSNRS
jgi:hypothetical protein